MDPDKSLRLACLSLLNAPHHDHFEARLGDEEMDAIREIKGHFTYVAGCGWVDPDVVAATRAHIE